MSAVDLFTTYQFVKRLVTPFNKWKAFNLGIIDAEGNQLLHRGDFKSQAERDAFGYLDILAMNLKKLLAKLPGGDKTIATYAAALLLLKEYPKVQKEDADLITNLDAIFESYMEEAALFEDAPTNSAGGGAIAAIGIGPQGEPPVSSKSRYKKKNEDDTQAIFNNVAVILKRNKP
jgi:hypothetical protein